MRNRSHNVMVRMDDEEYNQFCTNVKESGQTKQAYVTNAVLHVPVMPKEELEEVQKISQLMADDNRQLRGIAVKSESDDKAVTHIWRDSSDKRIART